jgi:hypothetical protein
MEWTSDNQSDCKYDIDQQYGYLFSSKHTNVVDIVRVKREPEMITSWATS